MTFRCEARDATGPAGPTRTCVLTDGEAAEAEVWPELGFNCLTWRVKVAGEWRDLLRTAPDWRSNFRPTRHGLPVLFPFPNRIRGGRFSFQGREYSLPLTDSSGKHAIHGFTPRRPWRVEETGADGQSAWVTARYRVANFPDDLAAWPGDCSLAITLRLTASSLRLDCAVENHGAGPVPFGLGFHPYLRFPSPEDEDVARWTLTVPADALWETADGLPTGRQLPPGDKDYRAGRALGDARLDDLFTLEGPPSGRRLCGRVGHLDRPGAVEVRASADFRYAVLFTPEHRRAVCVEPYTCATDAANLTARGIDAGWQVLAAGGRWGGVVELSWLAG